MSLYGDLVPQGTVRPNPTFLEYITRAIVSVDASTYNFAAQSLGAADNRRFIVVCVAIRADANNISIASISVGGVNCTQLVQDDRAAGSARNITYIGIAKVPTGTTGNVVVTLSAGATSCGIHVYRYLSDYSNALDSSVALGGSYGLSPRHDCYVIAVGHRLPISGSADGLVVHASAYSSSSFNPSASVSLTNVSPYVNFSGDLSLAAAAQTIESGVTTIDSTLNYSSCAICLFRSS